MRTSTIERNSQETQVKIEINLDGTGKSTIETPINFFNHMLESFSRHSLIDLKIKANGDIEIDQHHTIEDIGIVLGRTLRNALGDKLGIQRTGNFIFPMDDSLALVAIDLSGRPYIQFTATFRRQFCGDFDTDLLKHFFESLANNLGANIVIRLLEGENDHHKLEAIFKAFAKSMKLACSIDPRIPNTIPSTKEVIE